MKVFTIWFAFTASILVAVIIAIQEPAEEKVWRTDLQLQGEEQILATEADTLTVRSRSGDWVSINVATGEVQYSHLGTPDEAARVFWEAVSRTFQLSCVFPGEPQ